MNATLVKKNRLGASTVEFAIVLPLFLFSVIFPMIAFSRALIISNSMVSTAQIGCRAASLPGSTNASVQEAVKKNLASLGIKNSNELIIKVNGNQANVSQAQQGDEISVSVSVDYGSASWLPGRLANYLFNATLSSTHLMRRE
jgi:Flp pilus assembly protein TadG